MVYSFVSIGIFISVLRLCRVLLLHCTPAPTKCCVNFEGKGIERTLAVVPILQSLLFLFILHLPHALHSSAPSTPDPLQTTYYYLVIAQHKHPCSASSYPIRFKPFPLVSSYPSTALNSRGFLLSKFSTPVISQHFYLRRFSFLPPHFLHCPRLHQLSLSFQAPDSLPNRSPHQHAFLGNPGVHSRSK